MKKLLLISLLFVMAFGVSAVYAAEKASLGVAGLALKVDYINFTEEFLDDYDVDSGLYVGLEAYSQVRDISPNLYLGLEVGYANPEGSLDGNVYVPYVGTVNAHADTETTFLPIELNFKYAIEAAKNLIIDFGAGVSINYATAEISIPQLGISIDDDDWLWGGQFFVDLNYKYKQFFIGVNAKYQPTGDFEIGDFDTDVSATNWRVGGQIGIMF